MSRLAHTLPRWLGCTSASGVTTVAPSCALPQAPAAKERRKEKASRSDSSSAYMSYREGACVSCRIDVKGGAHQGVAGLLWAGMWDWLERGGGAAVGGDVGLVVARRTHPLGAHPKRHTAAGSPNGPDMEKLPIGRHTRHPASGPGSTSPGQSGPFAAGPSMIRLLIVEDDEFQQHAILELCKQCGYNARTASDASEALDMARALHQLPLISCPHQLPLISCPH